MSSPKPKLDVERQVNRSRIVFEEARDIMRLLFGRAPSGTLSSPCCTYIPAPGGGGNEKEVYVADSITSYFLILSTVSKIDFSDFGSWICKGLETS